ncbi:MAG: glycosyltransferase 87 family protein [Candidatus Thermoplasmatota archaeon]
MGVIENLSMQIINAVKRWSTKKKLLVLIVVWILIFVPAVMIYNSIQKEKMFSYYPESSSPINNINEDFDVSVFANGSKAELSQSEDRYVTSVVKGESVNFTWMTKNFLLPDTPDPHMGQVRVHYNTTWNENGVIILQKVEKSGEYENKTWKGKKTFQGTGKVYFYYRIDERDIGRFHRRASTLIQGGNLYEDTTTGPPPLINFIFIPPTLISPPVSIGGYFLSFYIYFSIFILLGGILLFYSFRDWGEHKAFIASILYIVNPISLSTIIQDESVIAFIIILTIFILIRGKEKLGALTIGLGSLTKVWSGFFIPAQLFDRNIRFKKRIRNFIMAASVLGGGLSSFYLMWGPKVFWFFTFYGGARSKLRPRDVSIWNHLGTISGSIPIPSSTLILLSIIIIEILLLYIAYKKRWDTISTFTATLFIFMLFYPKIHLDYYLLLMPTLLFYSVRNIRNFKLFVAFYVFLIISRGRKYLPTGPYNITIWISFIAGVMFTLIGLKIISLFITEDEMTKYFTEIFEERSNI